MVNSPASSQQTSRGSLASPGRPTTHRWPAAHNQSSPTDKRHPFPVHERHRTMRSCSRGPEALETRDSAAACTPVPRDANKLRRGNLRGGRQTVEDDSVGGQTNPRYRPSVAGDYAWYTYTLASLRGPGPSGKGRHRGFSPGITRTHLTRCKQSLTSDALFRPHRHAEYRRHWALQARFACR